MVSDPNVDLQTEIIHLSEYNWAIAAIIMFY